MKRVLMSCGVLAVAAACATPGPQMASRPMCLPCIQPCTPDSCGGPVKQAMAPTFAPAGGQYNQPQFVTIEGPPGATIRYTTDGMPPTASSPVYSGPIAVTSSTTLMAIASVAGQADSPVAFSSYDVALPPPPPVAAVAVPSRVVVTKEKLVLKEKVFFDTAKATIRPVSFSLLDEVAAALSSHEDVKRISVEGHTDNVGSAKYNKKLSQQRADSVRAYLVNKGVVGQRLDAKGFGEEKPIATNKTPQGREENRRVEFTIVE